MNSEKKFVVIALVGGFVTLIAVMGFASLGNVRHVDIFWPERIWQTLEFRDVDGQTVVVGTVGNSGTNPDLIMRTGDFFYILTVTNNDTVPHQLYIEGLDMSTKLLEAGASETITLTSKYEATYNYYDIAKEKQLLGTITAKYVTPLDEFEAR